MVCSLKKDDLVIVVSGKDKGKEGKVLKVLKSTNKVLVAGINMLSRHTKPSMTDKGGIIKKETPIHRSNVMLKDPESGKPTRVRIQSVGDNKVRVSVVSGKNIDDSKN